MHLTAKRSVPTVQPPDAFVDPPQLIFQPAAVLLEHLQLFLNAHAAPPAERGAEREPEAKGAAEAKPAAALQAEHFAFQVSVLTRLAARVIRFRHASKAATTASDGTLKALLTLLLRYLRSEGLPKRIATFRTLTYSIGCGGSYPSQHRNGTYTPEVQEGQIS